MTEIPRMILDMMKLRKLFRSPETRDRVLVRFNASILDRVEPVGGEQVMKVLSEMNSLADEHD